MDIFCLIYSSNFMFIEKSSVSSELVSTSLNVFAYFFSSSMILEHRFSREHMCISCIDVIYVYLENRAYKSFL